MISSWTFFWWLGGAASRSPHHQPSGPAGLGSACCVLVIIFFRLKWVLISTEQLRDGGPLMGKQDPAPRLFFSPWPPILSLPWLTAAWICPLEPREDHGAEWRLFPAIKEMKDTKALWPRTPLFFSTNGGPLTWVICPHLLAFWVFRVNLSPGFVVVDT